jgi:hypothetical protein
MTSPKKPLYYRIRDMAPYILSGDYRDTWIINPYDECFELDLLLNQLCFHYSFANRQVKPGLSVILFCQAHCLRPSVQQMVAIAGFTRSHDLLPCTPVMHTRCFLVIKRDTPPLPALVEYYSNPEWDPPQCQPGTPSSVPAIHPLPRQFDTAALRLARQHPESTVGLLRSVGKLFRVLHVLAL